MERNTLRFDLFNQRNMIPLSERISSRIANAPPDEEAASTRISLEEINVELLARALGVPASAIRSARTPPPPPPLPLPPPPHPQTGQEVKSARKVKRTLSGVDVQNVRASDGGIDRKAQYDVKFAIDFKRRLKNDRNTEE